MFVLGHFDRTDVMNLYEKATPPIESAVSYGVFRKKRY